MKFLGEVGLVAIIQARLLFAYCPPLGPILPESRNLLSKPDFQQAINTITE